MSAPRILDDLHAKRLEAQRRLATSCAPEDASPDRQKRRRWPVEQSPDALDAAARAGHAHFTRERDPDRAAQRYDRVPERTKQDRKNEFLASLSAFVAAGGRL